ncbi:hypothetical protein H6A37_08650 [Phocaeicola plebeius]|uniref:hypothetical protein n=1 Tax=Phocaeicola plebeius TaxID=310297 RepID=UPI00195C5B60|nr:hypothetical protein [Phocaeicola plebeius]MBM6963896.1 hypothetical protein [Phocaeicola plebeius]
MDIENKRILITCREVDTMAYLFLAKKWVKKNKVAVYFIKASEAAYKKNISNDVSYYAFKEMKGITFYDVNNITIEFTKSLKTDKLLDADYLNYIENTYTHFYNLNCQIVSSQSFIRQYHWRPFWRKVTYNQQLNWLTLSYKDGERVTEDFKPDIIINTDNDEIGRSVLREIAHRKKIPFITIEYPRYEYFKTFSYDLGLTMAAPLRLAYNNYLRGADSNLTNEYNYIKDFRSKGHIMSNMYQNDITSQYKPESIYKSIKHLIFVFLLLFKQDFVAGNYSVRKSNNVLFPSNSQYFIYFLHWHFYRQLLMRKNKFFESPVEGEKYVYMPLHLIPESSTSVLAPFYINELHVIEAVSKSLPAGWYLYVKEHQSMIGERGIDFYKRVKQLPNVRLVQINYYSDPKPWIEKSQGVVTITGTSAYEAALLGKHACLFSDVIFSCIDGIHRVHSFEELPIIFKEFGKPLDNIKSCASYIKTVIEFGEPVDLKYLLRTLPNTIINKEDLNDKQLENIDNIEKIIIKAYNSYYNQ